MAIWSWPTEFIYKSCPNYFCGEYTKGLSDIPRPILEPNNKLLSTIFGKRWNDISEAFENSCNLVEIDISVQQVMFGKKLCAQHSI